MSFLAKKTGPDLILLQEIWLRKHLGFIRKNLRGYHLYNPGKGIFNRSGLATFTRKKSSTWHFRKFPKFNGESRFERVAGKGYLITKLSFAGKEFNVINTHLNSQSITKKRKVAEQQFEMLKRIAAKGNWIISGDLNIDEPLFNKLNKGHFIHHSVKEFTVASENRYTHSRLNRFGGKNKKLDYTLVRSVTDSIRLKTKVLTQPLVSDHYAVLTTLSVKQSKK